MIVQDYIAALQQYIGQPETGLPEEIFEFVSSLTPMVNVDLLIYDREGRVLLSWRDDEYCGQGWHIPGGIIRFKESMSHRIQEVARLELGTEVCYNPKPLEVNEIMMPQGVRGHFISFLYRCYLPEHYFLLNQSLTETDTGFLEWHENCPDNLVRGQKQIYWKYFNENVKRDLYGI